MRLGAVLLASGFSRRYGSNKLLAEVDHVPLVRCAFGSLPPSLFCMAVVTTRFPEIMALAEEAGYTPLWNGEAEEGISAGLRLGLGALVEAGVDGALFAVCDQPRLTLESVERLRAAFRAAPDRITALSWQGKRGNPVIFPKDLFPALMALTGDRGGSSVIKGHPERLLLVEAGSAQELADVDVPADLS